MSNQPMTSEELRVAQAIVEIDDVRFAQVMIEETCFLQKELRMFRIAQLLAALRESYVEIGRNLEFDKLRNP